MNIFIVDDRMIDTWNWDVTMENLCFQHLKFTQRNFALSVDTIVYCGEGKLCKILKDRYLTDVEKFYGRIFPKAEFNKFIQESILSEKL